MAETERGERVDAPMPAAQSLTSGTPTASTADGHLGRNFLRGVEGDAINAILAGVGHNLRLLRRWLRAILCALLAWLTAAANLSLLVPAAHQIG